MADVRVGLIGCGGMGRELAQHLRQVPGATLVAVSDPVEEARSQAAGQFGVPAHADPAELIAREDVDAVIIAAPTYLHREFTLAAAAAGKHIFCEKPMALSVADCDEMLADARTHGVKLMVGQVLRLLFPFAAVAELAQDSGLGRPFAVDIARYGMWRPRAGWRRHRDQSGGTLFEMNVHELDFLRHLCGEVAEVSAVGGNYLHPELDYPDLFFITLRFRSGAVGRLRGGGAGFTQRWDGEALCPRGTLRWDRHEGLARVFRPEGEPEVLTPSQWTKPNGFVWELTSFVEWVRAGVPPVIPPEEARAAVELAQAAYQSLDKGRPITLPL